MHRNIQATYHVYVQRLFTIFLSLTSPRLNISGTIKCTGQIRIIRPGIMSFYQIFSCPITWKYTCMNLCRIFRVGFFRREVKYAKTCKHHVYRPCTKVSTLTPQVGLEPITPRLTAACSTIDAVTYRKISLATNYKQNRISHSIFASHHILFFR